MTVSYGEFVCCSLLQCSRERIGVYAPTWIQRPQLHFIGGDRHWTMKWFRILLLSLLSTCLILVVLHVFTTYFSASHCWRRWASNLGLKRLWKHLRGTQMDMHVVSLEDLQVKNISSPFGFMITYWQLGKVCILSFFFLDVREHEMYAIFLEIISYGRFYSDLTADEHVWPRWEYKPLSFLQATVCSRTLPILFYVARVSCLEMFELLFHVYFFFFLGLPIKYRYSHA